MVSDIYIINTLWPSMHQTKPSLQPQPLPKPSPPLQRPPVWRRLNNPSSPSRSSLTRSSNHTNLNGFNLPTHVDRSTESSSARKTSPTPNVMPSATGILPALKTPRPGESSQSGEVIEKKVTAGKPLLERLGMRELTLLERLGMPIRKGAMSRTCDGTGMTMTIPLEVSRSGHDTTMTSTTSSTLGTGVCGGEDLLGGVERMSALNEKLRCSRPSITSTPRRLLVVLTTKATAPNSLIPSGARSSAIAISTSELSLKISSPSKPSTMILSSLVKERSSRSAVDPQGRGDGSAPKVTGSLPGTAIVMLSSGPTRIAGMSSGSTTNTLQLNSPPALTTDVSHCMRLPHGNMSSKMDTSPLPTLTNSSTSRTATSTLTEQHTKMTSPPETDLRGVEVRKEARLLPAASITRKRGAPITHANSAMSAAGVEEITHDTDVPLRPSKRTRVGPGIDKSVDGARPRFLRFAFGCHDIGRTPSATYTESAQPIPSVPQGDYRYSDITSTIATHSHLFKIVTPIRVDRFEQLLTRHPNRSLVESVCHGLRVGFWPFANTGDPALQPLGTVERLSGPPNLHDQSISFLPHQRDEEVTLDRYSPSFGPSLLAGMTAQPVFTVPKKGPSKLRLVNDHSACTHSLNSLIPADGGFVKLDNISDLVTNIHAIMAQNGGHHPAWFWESDASQAYCQLPMHPCWQVCQATLIDRDYHVDRCAVFSNHVSGHCC